MSIKSKFLISLQHSGRRWLCNVIGHYDQYLLGEDPTGTWVKGGNPLKTYGTNKRWNIVPSHCNNGLGKDIFVPKFYRFRPAAILIRHPAKVFVSMHRGRVERIPGFDTPAMDFARDHVLDFFISYANTVYSGIGQSNKLFVPYNKIYAEQFSDSKDEWTKIFKFFFGSVDPEIMNKAIGNNVASDIPLDGVKRHHRGKPSELGELTDTEIEIREFIKPKLRAGLQPNIYKFLEEQGLC